MKRKDYEDGIMLSTAGEDENQLISTNDQESDEAPLLYSQAKNDSGDQPSYLPLRHKYRQRPSEDSSVRPYFTIAITTIDIILMIVEIIVNRGFEPVKKNPWIGVSLDTLITLGGKDDDLIVFHFQWWRLITPVFFHVGVIHLAINMVAQIILGIQLEKAIGFWRVSIIYFVSAVAGNLFSAMFLPQELEVGASTAIYGLSSYYLVDLIVHWPIIMGPWRYFAALMVGDVVGLVIGLFPGVDNFAHIGGTIGGLLISMVMIPNRRISAKGRITRCRSITRILGYILLIVWFVLCFCCLYVGMMRDVVWNCHWCEYVNCLPVFHWCG